MITPTSWLDATREASAIALCALGGAFRKNPDEFPAAKHATMRAYMRATLA